jgi:hypothetical protein
MPISTPMGIKVLDGIFRGIYFELPNAVHVRLWTVAPTPAGTGGTECTGNSVRPLLYAAAAQAGTAGRVAQIKTAQSLLFQEIDQPSTAVVAASVHDADTGEILWLGPWSPPKPWAAGGSPLIDAGAFTAAFTA